jgi:hypothetical protein
MDPTNFKEVGSFTVMLVPIMGAVLWGGKVLLSWFTRTIEREQESKERLMGELVSIMRETQVAHQAMVQTLDGIAKELTTAFAATTKEHSAIIACIQGRPDS